MDFLEMVPNDDEQIVVIGQNGRGKSAWLKKIISPYYEKRQIIIIDDKADDIWDGFGEIVHTVDGLYKKADKFEANPVVIFRPEGALAEDFDAHDEIYQWVYSRWYTIIATDESTKAIEFPGKIRPGLSDICTRGRKRHILRAFGVQRPTGVPRIIFSEAKRFYIKPVIDDRDRKIIEYFAGKFGGKPINTMFGMRYVNVASGEKAYFPEVPL